MNTLNARRPIGIQFSTETIISSIIVHLAM